MKKNFLLLVNTFGLCLLFVFALPTLAQEIIMTPGYHAGGYNIRCNGGNDGSINIVVVDGEGPFLYNWSNGSFSKNQAGLTAGTYSVIVTDINGNTFSNSIDLNEPLPLEVNLIPVIKEGGYNISENGGQDGEINASVMGGVSPYTYLWTGGSIEERITDLTVGTYTLVVTGINNCTASATTTLTEPSELQIVSISSPFHNGYNVSCPDGKDGAINLTVTGGAGGYTFQWSNGAFTKDLSELGPGNYSVIVRDEAGTAEAGQITLTGPTPMETQLTPTVFPNGKNVSCYGCANGHISTIISGGTPPYTYSWNDGGSTLNRNGLIVGGYNVQITDANGCISEAGLNIQGPEREDWTMTGNVGTNPGMNFIGTSDNKDVIIKTNNIERLRIKNTGQIELKNSLKVDSASADSLRAVYVDSQGLLKVSSGGSGQQPCTSPTNRWVTNYCASGNDIYNLPNSGNVGIGTSQIPAGYKLAVNGKIICEEVKVKLSSNWPDYVFKHDYKLMPLSELKKFINDKNHLPDIPSADEVEMEGNSIGDMQSKLLLKIEELTLYLVQQHEKLEKLENENIVLNKKLDVLSAKEMK